MKSWRDCSRCRAGHGGGVASVNQCLFGAYVGGLDAGEVLQGANTELLLRADDAAVLSLVSGQRALVLWLAASVDQDALGVVPFLGGLVLRPCVRELFSQHVKLSASVLCKLLLEGADCADNEEPRRVVGYPEAVGVLA